MTDLIERLEAAGNCDLHEHITGDQYDAIQEAITTLREKEQLEAYKPVAVALQVDNMKLQARIEELEIWEKEAAARQEISLEYLRKIEQYEQSLKHLWQWLPLMYRHDYLKDYPAEKEILQGNWIRGNDDRT